MYKAQPVTPAPIFEGTLKEMSEKIDEYKAAISKIGLDSVSKFFSEFFDQNPTIYGIWWTQYTPYFNDGDACVFGVGEFHYISDIPATGNFPWKSEFTTENYLAMHEDDINHSIWEFPTRSHWVTYTFNDAGNIDYHGPKVYNPIHNNMEELEQVLYKSSEVLLNTFGDHTMILATRGGFQIDDYDHD